MHSSRHDGCSYQTYTKCILAYLLQFCLSGGNVRVRYIKFYSWVFFLFFAIIREQKMSRIQEMSVNLTSTDHEDIRSLPKARVNVTDSRIHNMANNPSRDNFAKVVIVNKEHQITYCCHPWRKQHQTSMGCCTEWRWTMNWLWWSTHNLICQNK